MSANVVYVQICMFWKYANYYECLCLIILILRGLHANFFYAYFTYNARYLIFEVGSSSDGLLNWRYSFVIQSLPSFISGVLISSEIPFSLAAILSILISKSSRPKNPNCNFYCQFKHVICIFLIPTIQCVFNQCDCKYAHILHDFDIFFVFVSIE